MNAKAVILAAGRGSRLKEHTEDKPKCLLSVGGKTLLERNVENIRRAGFEKVVLILGYRHDMIEEVMAKSFSSDFYQVILNPDYTRGSASTLACAGPELEGDICIVESDLLYDYRILLKMMSSDVVNGIGMGDFNHDHREIKLYLDDKGIIRKTEWSDRRDSESAGDWVGFAKLSAEASSCLKKIMADAPDYKQEVSYEEFFFDLFKEQDFQGVCIRDYPWIEIDRDEDYQKALADVIPVLDKESS